jgi:hypothetical protein
MLAIQLAASAVVYKAISMTFPAPASILLPLIVYS